MFFITFFIKGTTSLYIVSRFFTVFLPKTICPVFEDDVYEAISMETCVNTRLTIGAPSKTAMEQVILLEEDYLLKNPVLKA